MTQKNADELNSQLIIVAALSVLRWLLGLLVRCCCCAWFIDWFKDKNCQNFHPVKHFFTRGHGNELTAVCALCMVGYHSLF